MPPEGRCRLLLLFVSPPSPSPPPRPCRRRRLRSLPSFSGPARGHCRSCHRGLRALSSRARTHVREPRHELQVRIPLRVALAAAALADRHCAHHVDYRTVYAATLRRLATASMETSATTYTPTRRRPLLPPRRPRWLARQVPPPPPSSLPCALRRAHACRLHVCVRRVWRIA